MYTKSIFLSLVASLNMLSLHGGDKKKPSKKITWSLTPSLSTIYNYATAAASTSASIQSCRLVPWYLETVKPVTAALAPIMPYIASKPVIGTIVTTAAPYVARAFTYGYGAPLAIGLFLTPPIITGLCAPSGKKNLSFMNSLKKTSSQLEKTFMVTTGFAIFLALACYGKNRFAGSTMPTSI